MGAESKKKHLQDKTFARPYSDINRPCREEEREGSSLGGSRQIRKKRAREVTSGSERNLGWS